MKKLSLNLEHLVVDSFATGNEAHTPGTVIGNWKPTHLCDTVNATCDDGATCGGATCGGGAEYTCALSCDTCDQYRCGTIAGYDCSNMIGCASEDGQCNGGLDMTVLQCPGPNP